MMEPTQISKIARWREQGLTVVFTNGCFDLLHPGHIQYLIEAKQLGDRLIVGLNSDASVRRLKGDHRPICDVDYRKRMLEALKPVDGVFVFSEDTPMELIKHIRPHIIVKGGDYTVDEVVGGEFVTSYGGEVRILPFLKGYSTTSLIERIKQTSS